MTVGDEMDSVDAVVIGAGIGGLVTGAILAEMERWRVLVLEKEAVIGGKCFAFEHFDGDEKTFHHLLFENARSRLLRSQPPLSELIQKKILANYVFEGGYHAFAGGDRSRISFIASALGVELKVHNSKGVLVAGDGKWHDLRFLMRNWEKEDVEEGKRLARLMTAMSLEEAGHYDHVDLASFLRSRVRSEKVRKYHEWVAGYSVGLNDPSLVSAGEYIKSGILVQCAGRSFHYGGSGQPYGGFNVMTRLFADIIREKGGTVQTGSPVEEIMVEDYRAVGVKVASGQVRAKKVICNVPIQRALSLLPDKYWPDEYRRQIERTQPLSGIHGWINLKRCYHPDFEGFFVVPVLPGCSAADGFRGDVFLGFEDVASYDSSRAPKGEGLVCFFAGLLPRDPDEVHNPDLVEKVIQGILNFFRGQYPDFDDNLNWYMIHMAEEVFSASATPGMVGDRRIRVIHPLVRDLYFTGDSVRYWGLGVAGTAGAAVTCAGAASGRDYSFLLPFYMR
jgi:phytoene dehydrogenase-like protein